MSSACSDVPLPADQGAAAIDASRQSRCARGTKSHAALESDFDRDHTSDDRSAEPDYSAQLAQARSQIEHLKMALVSNRRIAMAVGIIMNAYRISDDQAFAMLTQLSQQSNVKVRDLAEEVILTGAAAPPQL